MQEKPSVTAAVVASTLLLLRDDPVLAPLVVPEGTASIEAMVRRTIPIFGHVLDRAPWRVVKRAAHLAERVLSPGFIAHYALRKHAVREELRRAVDEGVTQVVLVGAGFDMLASAVPCTASVFEVDHPATQRTRRDVLATAPGRDVTFVPVDLTTTDLDEALRAVPSFDASADTVYVAEGLLMYLTADKVEAMLAGMGRSHAASRLILTVITPDPEGRVRLHSQRRVVDWCMHLLEEPFVWGEASDRLATTLERHGFEVDSITSTMEMRDRVLPRRGRTWMPRATGEVVAVATKRRRDFAS